MVSSGVVYSKFRLFDFSTSFHLLIFISGDPYMRLTGYLGRDVGC